jgi:O-antigen ligase/tetratricopeptide (TPR) repeat protein
VDWGLAAIVFVAPLFMGGRGAVGRLVLIALIAIVAVCWCARQCCSDRGRWRWSGVEWLLVAGLGLLVLQLSPLPLSLLNRLSPTVAELLPFWTSGADVPIGEWTRLSLSPEATSAGLVIYTAYAMLFLVVVQRVNHVEDVERLLKLVGSAAVAMAVLGIVQMLLGNGKFLWVYEHPSRTTAGAIKGAFQNQNHFAHMLVLGVAPLVWWLHRLSSGPKSKGQSTGFSTRGLSSNLELHSQLLWGGLAIVVLAVLLTYSRGGVLAFCVATVVCLGISVRQSWFGKRATIGMGALAVLMGLALSIYGYAPLMNRLRTLSESRNLAELSAGRHALWDAHGDAIPQFWLTGTGVGTHREIYRTYMEEHFSVEFTHGENGYLQQLLETGVLGTGLFLIGVLLICTWCFDAVARHDNPRIASCAGAIIPSLVASLVHAAGDFAWYIPACMSLTVILVACSHRLSGLVKDEKTAEITVTVTDKRPALPRPVWGVITAAVCLVGLSMIWDRTPAALAAPHWAAYHRLSRLPAEQRKERTTLEAMVSHLRKVVECDPDNPRAHAHLGILNLRRFDIEQQHAENPMPLQQIRDAALLSQFQSREDQDEWLQRAVGENKHILEESFRHSRRGIELCPLQGEAYVTLASLAFLEGPQERRKHAYVEQALLVRPYSGLVLYSAGQEAALAQAPVKALEYWKKAFHQDPEVRHELIELLAGQLPPQLLIDQFEPDVDGMGQLLAYYRRTEQEQSVVYVARRSVPLLQEEAMSTADLDRAASLWSRAYRAHTQLQQSKQALSCARRAVEAAPIDYQRRRELADALISNQHFDEAIGHLQWCLQRKPEDQHLQRQLVEARRSQLSGETATGRPGNSIR